LQEQNEPLSNFPESVLKEMLLDGNLRAILENAIAVGVIEIVLDR
jgi:hypothetical protein